MALRSVLYGWFGIPRKKPKATEFVAMIDTFFSKEEDELPINKVTNLTTVLNSKAEKANLDLLMPITLEAGINSWQAPSDILIRGMLIVAPTAIEAFKAGSAAGQDDYAMTIPANGKLPLNVFFYLNHGDTIYFTGVHPDTVIKLFK